MKINFNDYNLDEFNKNSVDFCGIPALLIFPPHIGIKFNQSNKIFRSSIWDLDGNLLSAGMPKFTNFGENPENFPVPMSVDGVDFITKIDGSLTIIDYVNGKLSMRTRGTSSYKTMENAADFEYCLSQYPLIESWLKNHPNYTILCEITTPKLKIVLDYGADPLFWLIGCINKDDYSLMSQTELYMLAIEFDIPRPNVHRFESIDAAIETIKGWNGEEGVCLYSNNGQTIHKIKAEAYLVLHRFKENANIDSVVDMFVALDCPSFSDFEKFLTTQYDWECWNMIRGFASQVCDSRKEVDRIVAHMESFALTLKQVSRKDAALAIVKAYGETNRASFAFKLLDGHSLTEKEYKK